MRLGIDPRVDFACKLMLGSPDHPGVTIHFLNSLLKPAEPIVEVEILNPLVGKDRSEDKIIVLDVLARDRLGRLFNIEMQTRIPLSFPSRLLYYNCRNYVRQLHEGEGYTELRPAISICLLDRRMFHGREASQRWHHSFRLRCDQDSSLVLTDGIEFHIFELPKFRPSSDNVSELPRDQKWLFLFANAAEMDAATLASELDEAPYREAIGVLEMISKSPEDLQYYEDRLKYLRDERGILDAARLEGLEEGRAKGRAEGREQGREEGLERGKLTGKIQALEELLDDSVTSDEVLGSLSLTGLAAKLHALNERIKKGDR